MDMDKHELIRKTFPFMEKDLISEIAAVSSLIELKADDSIMGEGDYIKSNCDGTEKE